MYEKYRSELPNLAWVLLPSLIYSFVVRNLVVCIDPLVVQSFDKMLSKRLRICVRAGWLLSFGIGLLSAWNILPSSYLFYWREALPFTPPKVLISLAAVTMLLFWLQCHRISPSRFTWLSHALAVVGLVLLGIKLVVGLGLLDVKWIRQHLKSPAIGLVSTAYHMSSNRNAPIHLTPAATFNAFVREQHPLPSKIVVMLVESWGENPDTLTQMGESMQSERLRLMSSGFTTYHGSTLSGEFRELCSKYLLPSDEFDNDNFRLDCAPAFLQRHGYRTWGLHGYQKAFYARGTFWGRFGFTDMLFAGDLGDLEHCPGSFEGVCDTALIKRGIDVLNRDAGPSFVYMLTLSGHEPLPPGVFNQPAAFFNGIEVVHPTQVVSRRAISDLVVELERKPERPCTLVYVVSDHQPPSASSQGDIFQNGQVPFLSFTYNCASVVHDATS